VAGRERNLVSTAEVMGFSGAPRMRQLTADHQKIIEAAFAGLNVNDEDAALDTSEMKKALQKIDPQASEEEILLLVDTIDADGSGDISLEEFREFLQKKILGLMDDDEMMHKFEATFDKHLTGVITPHELRQMLIREGEYPLSDAEANEFVELAETLGGDRSSNGLIEYRPFLKWLKQDHQSGNS
jgi:Ca2+-binding EF-hand superfamily protein